MIWARPMPLVGGFRVGDGGTRVLGNTGLRCLAACLAHPHLVEQRPIGWMDLAVSDAGGYEHRP
jgi:hypothetical protein